jgi:hypothetical protein
MNQTFANHLEIPPIAGGIAGLTPLTASTASVVLGAVLIAAAAVLVLSLVIPRIRTSHLEPKRTSAAALGFLILGVGRVIGLDALAAIGLIPLAVAAYLSLAGRRQSGV